MKPLLLFVCSFFITIAASSQILKTGDEVEVDTQLADSSLNWTKAAILGYDTVQKVYKVKIHDGDKMDIPSREPEKWIRPAVSKQIGVQYGPGAKIPYQNRLAMIQPIDCRFSEKFVKKNLRTLMASEYKDFESIYVNVTAFKPQHGYEDSKIKGRLIYPYKIEMLVHLKRTVLMGGRLYTEYQTWEYDREYAGATLPKKKCEFYPLQTAGPKLLSRAWFGQGW
jgi:hypothetical protein